MFKPFMPLLSRLRDLLRAGPPSRPIDTNDLLKGLEIEAEVKPLLSARRENRMIITEYPYRARCRSTELTASGRRLTERLLLEEPKYAELLRGFLKYSEHISRIRIEPQADSGAPFWDNGWLPPLDAVSLYGLLALHAPRQYIEIGSGNSTRFARRVVRDLGLSTRIVSIDPQPRADIDLLCDEIVRLPSEDVDPEFWATIGPGDVLFVDNSHRCFPNSDVMVFFTEILPALPFGTIYGLHDVFLPFDYPGEWMDRFYNEQYLLQVYLDAGAAGDEVILPVNWVSRQVRLRSLLQVIWDRGPRLTELSFFGGAFWMRRGTDISSGHSARPSIQPRPDRSE